ncbi:class I SAM-dependent methyltransferase [Vagococcus silagei]|uniref:Class I SAM-dependent methyltransferase n=1 Tax=Vagococcus silagei TaxID=2508885 RepID=A0A4S3B0F2_9ENTE|nr:class I SAM-dependent methyltransferase [Vagococcus silagei]THB60491.1 class I SAM-dependent methyltransferase [Vagococcus silagei]
MNKKQLKNEWLISEDRQKYFKGWDFSSISKDFWQESTDWDYFKIVNEYLQPNMSLLDMGTGGGELLMTFKHPPLKTSVTEGWVTNFELLQKRLTPKGIIVKFVQEDDFLDFPDNSFDIVLNSHESFLISEVKRVLKPKGIFITQQVGDMNGVNLASRLIPNYQKDDFTLHLSSVVRELRENQFDVFEQFEAYPIQKFFSMDALIYYVRTISWEFPNFSVETHMDELMSLQEELLRTGYIYNQEHRFMVVAKNN